MLQRQFTQCQLPLPPTYLWEIPEYFRHFIPTFSASNINNDIAVGILGQRLWDHRLSTAKGTWYSRGATLHATTERQPNGWSCKIHDKFMSPKDFLLLRLAARGYLGKWVCNVMLQASLTGKVHLELSDRSAVDDLQVASLWRGELVELAKPAPLWTSPLCLRIQVPEPHPG